MSGDATRFGIVLTTAGSDEQAERIASALVEQRLAACVNVVPGVVSFYRWEGEVRRDHERLLIAKTTVALFPAVRDAIVELHSYDVPEVVLVPVLDGSASYLDWIVASTGRV